MERRSFGIGVLFLLLAVRLADAQVASLGKGWLLDSAGSLTSAPAQVISGGNSIKGSYSGSNSYTPFLYTDPTFIQFTPNQAYTITLSYRIITTGSAGFSFGFFSGKAGSNGPFVPTGAINGSSGASGTATLTATLFNFPDYAAGFKINGTGAIAIDDIRITTGGQLVAMENAEGPTIAPGPLNFQLTDAIALVPDASANIRSAAVKDLNGDGYPETILTLTAPRPSTIPIQPIIIEASGQMRLATSDFFPAGAPTVKHSPVTLFADINHDGLQDILFAEAQYDGNYTGPRTGPGLGVALNLGGGKYRNVQPLIPSDQQINRSYALAVGDVLGDSRVAIILSDEDDGANTALLRWNGNGFDEQRNWIASSLWKSPTNLVHHDWLVLSDVDGDGRQDLIVGGSPAPCTPNLRILFGASGGFSSAGLLQLPNGPFGQGPCASFEPVAHNASLGPIAIADFNNDGLPDVFAIEEQVLTYQPGVFTDTSEPDYANIRANGGAVFGDIGLQVLINQGVRQFADVTSASTAQNLGRRHYFSAISIDMNNDGFLDVVGLYQTKLYAGVHEQWGTTVFLNDGTGAFQVLDGAQLLAAVTTTPSNGQRWNLGSFVPTVVNPQRTEGIVFESVGGCGGPLCAAPGLNIYKVVANGALGTGPNFVDPASQGVPGFSEFYYLRHYPDAAAAVQAGQYSSGLAHYLAVGAAKGYRPHALRALVSSRAPTAADFDDDARADLAVFRPTNGTWYLRYSARGYSTTTADAFQWGVPGDIPISGDFDGDGKTELAVFRPSNGTWYIRYSSLGYDIGSAGVFQWGAAGDVPIAADFDGDGRTELTVWRPSNGVWYIRYSSFGFNIDTAGVFQWGAAGDVPIAADVDGDGKTDLTVWRPSNGVWYIRYSSFGFNIGNAGVFQWGVAGDVPIAADVDGDGKTELTVWRPSNGVWYIRYSSFGFNIGNAGVFQWGTAGDVPIAADFDGDGKTELTVWRPSNGVWYIRYSSFGFNIANAGAFQWGLAGDAVVK